MDSFSKKCTPLKQEYDACFNDWYSNKFLKGKGALNECQEHFNRYQECIKKELSARGIETMLSEARREAPFEDGGKFNQSK